MNEVSCRLLIMFKEIFESEGLNWEHGMLNVGYTREHVLNPKNTVSWDAYTQMIEKSLPLIGGMEGLKQVSRKWGVGKQMLPVRRACRACMSATFLYRTLFSFTLSNNFRGIFKHSTSSDRINGAEVLTIRAELQSGLTGSLGFFVSTTGVLEGYPNLLGYPKAKVEVLEISPHHGVYRIEPPRFTTLWNRLVSAFETPFRVKDTLTTISSQETALWENYQQLERQKNDLEALLGASAQAIALVSDGKVLFANPALVNLLKLSTPAEVVGTPAERWLEPGTLEGLEVWASDSTIHDENRDINLRNAEGASVLLELAPPRSVR